MTLTNNTIENDVNKDYNRKWRSLWLDIILYETKSLLNVCIKWILGQMFFNSLVAVFVLVLQICSKWNTNVCISLYIAVSLFSYILSSFCCGLCTGTSFNGYIFISIVPNKNCKET